MNELELHKIELMNCAENAAIEVITSNDDAIAIDIECTISEYGEYVCNHFNTVMEKKDLLMYMSNTFNSMREYFFIAYEETAHQSFTSDALGCYLYGANIIQ